MAFKESFTTQFPGQLQQGQRGFGIEFTELKQAARIERPLEELGMKHLPAIAFEESAAAKLAHQLQPRDPRIGIPLNHFRRMIFSESDVEEFTPKHVPPLRIRHLFRHLTKNKSRLGTSHRDFSRHPGIDCGLKYFKAPLLCPHSSGVSLRQPPHSAAEAQADVF